MTQPRICIDIHKIEENARVISSACKHIDSKVTGVVKMCMGDPRVAHAMIRAGITTIADSRLANLEKLHGLGVPLLTLRQPMHHEIDRIVQITDSCLVSELETIKLIDKAASANGKQYKLIVMVESGDLREGVLANELVPMVEAVDKLSSVVLEGVGTNVACLQGVAPSPILLERLVEYTEGLRNELGIECPIVSGGNSSVWKLIESNTVPQGINHFRIGEGILLGRETIDHDKIPETWSDAFMLEAEIIELKDKPVDARSVMRRAIVAIGSQDLCQGLLEPLDVHSKILRRSSDHLVVDITDSSIAYGVGDLIKFIPSYEAALATFTSPFVDKVFINFPSNFQAFDGLKPGTNMIY